MTAALILSGLAVVRAGSLLAHPFGRCRLRRGNGEIRRTGRRRAPKCQLRKGLKRRQRLGSRTVHRIRRQVAARGRGPR